MKIHQLEFAEDAIDVGSRELASVAGTAGGGNPAAVDQVADSMEGHARRLGDDAKGGQRRGLRGHMNSRLARRRMLRLACAVDVSRHLITKNRTAGVGAEMEK